MQKKARMTLPAPVNHLRNILLGGLILLLVIIAYYPAFHAGFIWDDDMYVTHNPLLTTPGGLWRIWFSKHFQSQYFPLVYTTLKLEHALWGLKPFGYHFVNVLMHAANALFLWKILGRLALPGAWLAAAMFALHPVQVESVAWVTELKNTESTFFFFLAMLAWLRFLNEATARPWRYYILTVIMYLLALFSKTTTCTLPAALLLIIWLKHKPINRARILQIIPFLGIGLAMGLLSIWWEGHLGNYAEELGLSFSLPERLIISTHAVWFYAAKLVWPVSLCFSYARWQINAANPLQYIWLLGCLVLAGGLLWRYQRWGRKPIAAVVFFVATLSPMLGFISEYTFRFSFVADHYQYLASVGLIALLAGLLSNVAVHWQLNQITQTVLTGVLLASLAALTWQQAAIYQNLETLWRDTLAKNPDSWMAEYNLGLYLAETGRGKESMDHFRTAIKLNPRHAKARVNLAMELNQQGQTAEAIDYYGEALKINPNFALAHYDLGVTLANQGKLDIAIEHFRKAAQLNPKLADAWKNLVIAETSLGHKDEVLETLRQEVQFDPDNLEALYNLAQALAGEQKLDEAVAIYHRALQVSPGNLAVLNNLGNLLFMQGHIDDAIVCLKQAAKIDVKNPGVRFNLAMMLLQKGDRTGAREQLNETLRLKPDLVQAQEQLRALDAPTSRAGTKK